MLAVKVTGLMFKIIVMVSLGFILSKAGIIEKKHENMLSSLLLNGVMPFGVLAASNAVIPDEQRIEVLVTFLITFVIYAGAILIGFATARLLKLKGNSANILMTLIVFANTAFVGMPIMTELYGDAGLLYSVTYNSVYNVIFFTFIVHLFESAGSGGQVRKESFLTGVIHFLKRPVSAASVVMMILFFARIPLPQMVMDTCSAIGAVVVPLSMIIIGASLNGIRIRDIFSNRMAWLVTVMRLAVLPGIVYVFMRLSGAPEMVRISCVLMTALPCGTMNVVMSKQYHVEEELATVTVIQTMIVFLAALPVWMMILGK